MALYFIGVTIAICGFINRDSIGEDLRKLKSLKNNLKSTNPSHSEIRCYLDAIRIAIQGRRQRFFESILKTEEVSYKIDNKIKKRLEVKYTYNCKDYVIPVFTEKGPKDRIEVKTTRTISDEDMILVDDIDFLKYMGPNGDFHGLRLTPEQLGYYHVRITTQNGTFNFTGSDIINIQRRMV